MKANIKPLLISSLERSVQGEGSYFVEAPISVRICQVEMKHRKVSSEKMFLDKHSPPLDVTYGLLLSIFWPPKRDVQDAPSHVYTHTPTLTHLPMHTHLHIHTLTHTHSLTYPLTLTHTLCTHIKTTE